MGRHYRKKKVEGFRVIRLALLLLLIAALVYVVAERLGAPIAKGSRDNEKTALSADIGVEESPKNKKSSVSADIDLTYSDAAKKENLTAIPTIKLPADKKYSGSVPILAFIVDDGGEQMEYTKRVASLDIPLTWAIIPYRRYSKETLELAQSKGTPSLLHMPMQAQRDKDSSQYIIGNGMSASDVRRETASALDSLPGVIGLNNHRGSLATANSELMAPVMAELKKRGLIFVDSRTSATSVAYRTAIAAGVPALQNLGFLDNTADKSAIAARFRESVKNAQKHGALVVICHFRPSTVIFLEELDKNYKELPVKLVTIPEMLKLMSEDLPKEDI